MESHNICSFVAGFFPLALCFQRSSTVAVFHWDLQLKNIPLLYIPHFIYPPFSWWTFGFFSLMAIRNKTSVNSCMEVLCGCVFISVGYIHRTGTAGSYSNRLFFKLVVPSSITTSSVWTGPPSPHPHQYLLCLCEVVSHYSIDMNFPES